MPAVLKAENEDFYNPSGYADYLPDEHYHHSDKGCQVEMTTQAGSRKGEPISYGVVKKCLTHGVLCSKTGWEMGMYSGKSSRINYCANCGKELSNNWFKYCEECSKISTANNFKRYKENRRNKA